jgi:hypothetical protein
MKKWLRAQPQQPTSIDQLQALIDEFVDHYNERRPHRSHSDSSTPAAAYLARPKAKPGAVDPEPHDRCVETAWTPLGRSPCESTVGSTTSAWGVSTPEPPSSCSSTTSRSESSRPPPASSYGTSPWIRPGTVNQRAPRRDPLRARNRDPRGFGCFLCLARSHGGAGRDRTCDRGIMSAPHSGASWSSVSQIIASCFVHDGGRCQGGDRVNIGATP